MSTTSKPKSSQSKKNTRSIQLNVPALVWMIGGLAVVSVALFFWHQYARKTVAGSFLDQAKQAIALSESPEVNASADEANERAIANLNSYLALRPDDEEVRVLLADTSHESWLAAANLDPSDVQRLSPAAKREIVAMGRRNIRSQVNALSVAPDGRKADLSLRIATLFNSMGDFTAARKAAEKLVFEQLTNTPDDQLRANAYQQLALAISGQLRKTSNPTTISTVGEQPVGKVLAEAIELNPDSSELPVSLAVMYRDPKQRVFLSEEQRKEFESVVSVDKAVERIADGIVADMVKRNAGIAQAYIASHIYKQRFQIADAGAELITALDIDPEDPQANYLRGIQLLKEVGDATEVGQPDSGSGIKKIDENLLAAAGHFERAIKNNPSMVEPYLALGDVYVRLARNDDAIKIWKEGLEKGATNNAGEFSRFNLYRLLTATLIQSENENHHAEAQTLLETMKGLIDKNARSANVDVAMLRRWSQSHEYLAALMQFQREELGTATKKLKQLVRDGDLPDNLRDQAHTLLGQISLQLGQFTDAAAQLEARSGAQAGDPSILMQTARIYSNGGNHREASSIYRRVARATNSDEVWLRLAGSLYSQQLALPKPDRDWSEFDRAIENSRTSSGATTNAEQERIDYLDALAGIQKEENPNIQKLEAPLKQLQELADSNPDASRQLAIVYNRLGEYEKSDEWLETYSQQLESDLDQPASDDLPTKSETAVDARTAILKAGLLAQRSDFKQAERVLELAVAESEANQSATLELKVAAINLLLKQAKPETAYEQMRQLVDENPLNGSLLFDFVEYAIRLKKIDTKPADWESKLAKFEPQTGKYTGFLRANRLLNQAKQEQDDKSKISKLEEANQIRTQLTSQFGNWPLLNVLAGDIYLAWHDAEQKATDTGEDDQDSEQRNRALYFYRQAAQAGETGAKMLMTLADLEPDIGESKKWRDMVDSADQNELVVGTKLQIAIRKYDFEDALRLAERATEIAPKDPRAWVRRARLSWELGSFDDADRFANKAKELLNDNSSSELWQALFIYRAIASESTKSVADREKQVIAAKQIIPKIIELTNESERKLKEAQLLAAIDDPQAAQLYLEAKELAPNDIKVLESMVVYFSRASGTVTGALDHAIEASEKLVELKPQESRYRDQLAGMLAARGLESDWRKLGSLLGAQGENSQLDNRTYAILLLQKNNVTNSERIDNLDKAMRLLKKQISESSDASAVDRVLLGQIYRRQADLTKNEEQAANLLKDAAECFESAVNSADISFPQLYIAGLFFLEQGEVGKAKRMLNRLQAASADNKQLSHLPVALQSRIIVAENSGDTESEIVGLCDKFAERVLADRSINDLQKSRLYVSLAQICYEAGLPEQSVDWYRKAADENPRVVFVLSNAYLNSGDYREALNVLTESYDNAGNRAKPLFVQLISNILLTMWSDDEIDVTEKQELFELSRPILATAEKEFSRDLMVLISIANVQLVVQNDVDRSIKIYKQALDLAPQNTLLLNNLATVLSDDSARLQDAIDTIDLAIQISGRIPQLLDTKAVILFKQEKLDEAEELLMDIVHAESDSRYWWHLAEVKWQRFEATKNKLQAEKADEHLRQAIEVGLESTVLTPGEKERLLDLKTDLEEYRQAKVSMMNSHSGSNLDSDSTQSSQSQFITK